jgi:hypothetical protein
MASEDRAIFGPSLAACKEAIGQAWLARTLETYPAQASGFLAQDADAFRNPIGHTVKESLAGLLDELLGEMDVEKVKPLLDGIVRIRAVQDFSASQAVAFLFALKTVVRDATRAQEGLEAAELAILDSRIDELALLAFDLFMRCREKVYEVSANEARRRASLLEKTRGRHRNSPPEPERTTSSAEE